VSKKNGLEDQIRESKENWSWKIDGCTLVPLILLIVLIIIYLFTKYLPLHPAWEGKIVPISITQIVGGIDNLSRGKVVELKVYIQDDKGTLEPKFVTYGRVEGIVGETPNSVLMSVPTENVLLILDSLVNSENKFTYHIVKATATPTPTEKPLKANTPPSITPTYDLTKTPTPLAGHVYWEVPINDFDSRSSTLQRGEYGKLVIIKSNDLTLKEGTPIPVEPYESCVKIEDFLNNEGIRIEDSDLDQTNLILLQISASQIGEIAQSLLNHEHIYFVSDASCEE